MASKKSRTRKKTTSKKNNVKKSPVLTEVYLLISIAVCIFLELSLFGLGAKAGYYLSGFLFGLFGFLAYIFPVLLLLGIGFLVINKGNGKAVTKTIAGAVLYFCLCTLWQLVSNSNDTGAFSYYTYSATYHAGGGFLGGMIAKGLCSLIGIYGAYIFLIILIIICVVILSEKSFIKGVKSGSSRMYNTAKDDARKFKEQREINKENEKRMYKKAKGVPVIKLKDAEPFSDEVHEITSDEFNNKVFRGHVELNDMAVQDTANTVLPEDSTSHLYTQPDEQPQPEELSDSISKESVNAEPVMEAVEGNIHNRAVNDLDYTYPPVHLLSKPVYKNSKDGMNHLNETANKLQETLQNFGVKVTITDYSQGPSVTRYELQPEMGTKVSRITSLVDDIKLNLAVSDIRIEAPIPGKAAIGIEVPNEGKETVYLRELLESKELSTHPSKIAFAAGKDISGHVVVADIAKMPHMLVAGTTGSGKSVFINSIIMTVLFRAKPSEVKLIIIDPKVVEFGIYNEIPHLLFPVVTDPKQAASALNWAVAEMSRRYKLLAEYNVRDFKSYNNKIEKVKVEWGEEKPEKMPQILIVIDELADLMMVAAKAVEDSICRLAQLARAAGIHLIIATQRPSVDVVTGLIKANVPSRVALLVSSGTDSRTIIDMNGAEKLLGNGDMLFYPSGYVKPIRVQGAFISDAEVAKAVKFLKENSEKTEYDPDVTEHIFSENIENNGLNKSNTDSRDEYFIAAGRFVIEREKASASMLQRKFNVGFNRAARIIDQLCELGVVGEEDGPKPRKVIMSIEEFEETINE